ncbi:Lectin C-type domain-containing protein [Selenomonas ruminantium]|uniref:Lectin C-type domain-containing protein n=1 Tax=Selenomonas ruminantium TaxID=971 RepID=A0A1M6R4S3_SELRU|nr:LamG-like jellyroll fold domain-containing protein [Selenomonas ruminantium]SHK27475.1 Lectin C-type domain-containing protein [Selenomonas ruminantium]
MKNRKRTFFLAAAVLTAISGTALADAVIPADAHRYNGHFYYVFDGVANTWEEAERYCESRGGYLAIINDAAENQSLYDYIKRMGKKDVYFGLTEAGHPNVWRWVDGAPLTYQNWNTGEPNHGPGEHYGMYYTAHQAYTWNDGDFGLQGSTGSSKAFLCEWDSLRGSNPHHKPGAHKPPGHRPPVRPGHHGPGYPPAQPTPPVAVNHVPVSPPAAKPVPVPPQAAPMNLQGGKLVCYLRFNDSAIKDDAGNSWGGYSNPQLDTFGAKAGKALNLKDKAYIQLNKAVTFGGQDFTVDFWLNMSSYSGSYARAFVFYNTQNSNTNALLFYRVGSSGTFATMWNNASVNNSAVKLDHLQHIALVYRHDLGVLTTYVDGKKSSELKCTIPRTQFNQGLLGKSNYTSDGLMVGTMDEFRVIDGAALWKADFVPPTAY